LNYTVCLGKRKIAILIQKIGRIFSYTIFVIKTLDPDPELDLGPEVDLGPELDLDLDPH
jgi:hypothetical protein